MAVKLKALNREDHKKSTTKAIRENGQVPAVVYGKAKEAKSIAVDSLALIKTVRDEGRNTIISLDVENDKPVDVMLHDYQIDPIKDELLHADFYVVNMAEEMDVEVPLRLEGEANGTKEGGVLQQPFYELQVRAKPGNIPEEISIDVSNLGIGDSIAIADLPQRNEYQFLDDPETTIATIVPPDTLKDVEEAPDENDEPELVDRKGDAE
ncbi:50S ribosomal protein L25/general stress protein Ctc [Virgibacillus dakarensis]|uniref:Large ribosomal subunit protein bL25 n=1 Tax=Lentibacillus populi TaxID=1827502 RepID=A0A9W5X6X7_9BACI|nr:MULTISPECIES: 50S ribosomal protein L25/general stress protein Ctc [Bacillaceae]MBT2218152.1 50S ribosomal protein L25/general stress protein Ctc [Virgibacillus dakarensis]MTW86517.1 50S ribosomal protein L25/general stress protein Ctc [Virgibacillus dakarensis]GGB51117.1 general stress protein CTC [Lentibacillus populi]